MLDAARRLSETAAVSEGDLAAGAVVGGAYQIVRLLGEGGMGAVYEAQHVRLKKRVAVKILFARMATDPTLVARFVREGQAAVRIDHPHIVEVYDVGMDGRMPYLVMEFLDGEDLESAIERSAPYAPADLVAIALPICSAIHAAHEVGVVHRDLKPPNVMLARTKVGAIEPKVLDFGIARIVEGVSGVQTTRETMGSPLYMSPEHFYGGNHVIPASDQFSLGVILYEMATGSRPFEADSLVALMAAITTGRRLPILDRRPDLPPPLAEAIERALDTDPTRRFPDLRALGRALLSVADAPTLARWGAAFSDGSATPPPAAPSPSGSHPRIRTPDAVANTAFGPATTGPAKEPTRDEASAAPTVAASAPARRWWPVVGAGLAVLIGVGVFAGRYLQSPPDEDVPPMTAEAAPEGTTPEVVAVTARPPNAAFELDGVALGAGPVELVLDGRPHSLRVTAPGHVIEVFRYADTAPSSPIELQPLVPAVAPAVTEAPEPPATEPTAEPLAAPTGRAGTRRAGRPGRPTTGGATSTEAPPPPLRDGPRTGARGVEIERGANDAPILD